MGKLLTLALIGILVLTACSPAGAPGPSTEPAPSGTPSETPSGTPAVAPTQTPAKPLLEHQPSFRMTVKPAPTPATATATLTPTANQFPANPIVSQTPTATLSRRPTPTAPSPSSVASLPTPPTMPAPTLASTPTPTKEAPALLATVLAQVVRVIDGDTIDVNLNGSTYRVRYIGIDTPETVHPDKPVQPYGPEATAKNKELVEGKTVRLEKDVSETDKYGRLLRYVYVGDVFVNAELVRLGLAQVTTIPPDVKYVEMFLRLQRDAQEAGKMIWKKQVVIVDPPEQMPLRIISVTSPVKRRGKATLIAETTPSTTASITVYYKSGSSEAKGLEDKKADSSGRVSWTWTVGSSTTPGTYRIVVATGPTSVETMFIVQ